MTQPNRKRAEPKLTLPQWCMLVELSEPNKNDDNEWRITGRGPLASARSLVKLGLAKSAIVYSGPGEIFALTEAGKLRAKAGP
jgi:hypothetical protein